VRLKRLPLGFSLIFSTLPGPYGAGIFDPRSWGDHRTETDITLEVTRVVLAIGVFAVGVELPKAYMRSHWRSLLFLLAPVMTYVGTFPLSVSFDSHPSFRGGLSPLGLFMP
jgi:NhaP-type Na+/H+ or K+/H+ antiporter